MEATPKIMTEDFLSPDHAVLGGLKTRLFTMVRVRWGVVFIIAVATWPAFMGKLGLPALVFGCLAAFAAAANMGCQRWGCALDRFERPSPNSLLRFACFQTGLDVALLFSLIIFTGSLSSPLIYLLVPLAGWISLTLPHPITLRFTGVILLVLLGLVFLEAAGLPPIHSAAPPILAFGGRLAAVGGLGAAILAMAWIGSREKRWGQERFFNLVRRYREISAANEKLRTLYDIIDAIGTAQRLEKISQIISGEFAAIMQVKAISIKLLSEDGKYLRFLASHGLPEIMVRDKVVEVEKSPLNKRILQGEPYVTGRPADRDMFQFGKDLAGAGIQSVLFLPLRLEGRVIGTMGVYCVQPERFSSTEIEYFQLAAGLLSMALENARAYEAIEKLVQERSWYMMRVTHNLRAPLAAMLSILDVVRSGYLGDLNDRQIEYLRRLDRRTRTMLSMINELMTIAGNRDQRISVAVHDVDIRLLARRIRRTFQDEARDKQIRFEVIVAPDTSFLKGNFEMVEQLLENLVSNAIKYTPEGGSVTASFQTVGDGVEIKVKDTGIGIPKSDIPKLFNEFFRAQNARDIEKTGTGLGLVIVKEMVSRLGGRIHVESEQGAGTVFTVRFPVSEKREDPS